MTARSRLPRPSRRLLTFEEPQLRFAHEQMLEDPKDGLALFGPPEKPIGVQYGLIGTPQGIRQFKTWARTMRGCIQADPDVESSVLWPGFDAVFRQEWPIEPRALIEVDAQELSRVVHLTDAHQRVFDTVELFSRPIERWVREEDPKVALWFVVVPEELWALCRPKSRVSRFEGVRPSVALTHATALRYQTQPGLFPEDNIAAEKHLYENHFHNQLKAKLLGCEAVTQILRQTTIAPEDYLDPWGRPVRKLQDNATVAWNLGTAIYYKAGAKPWTLASIRDGVCYVGLVFKRSNNPKDPNEACCGAQMFLHTGEGIVFKGAVGAWGSTRPGEYHLSKEKAADIVSRCVETYVNWHNTPPRELFIHGRTVFNAAEIAGFRSAAPKDTAVTGIQIQRSDELKLFREGRRPVLRGVALEMDPRNAFLWTAGYVPKLLTYPGREVPRPLRVRIVFGDTKLGQVLADIMALTKVNFNACTFSDGLPVTLRFANDVGEILTAIPDVASKPLPFRHYI